MNDSVLFAPGITGIILSRLNPYPFVCLCLCLVSSLGQENEKRVETIQ